MKIIGAGISGLVAATMLRHLDPLVLETQPALPNNHSAVLRFRSHTIGDVTGIEFKKVDIIKASLPWRNPVADALAYAYKNSSVFRSDRSIPTDIIKTERYIAPRDFIATLAKNAQIKYAATLTDVRSSSYESSYEPIISTIPMPALMKILEYPKQIEFSSIAGTNLIARVSDCDAYVSLYVPNPDYPFSRISLTGDELVAEIPGIFDLVDSAPIEAAALLLGIVPTKLNNILAKRQAYAKIQPIDDGERKRFITWASDNFNVYSLGRYACWRPHLLLDDLVQDIRLIERWMRSGSDSNYVRKLHSTARSA